MSTSGRRTRTRKVELALVAALLSGCQCLPPAIERPDGGDGPDAGRDSGVGGPACEVAKCTPMDAGPGCEPSCIADECLTECPGGRTCQVEDAGRCLACGVAAPRCAPDTCTARTRCQFTVESSTCVGLLDDGVRGSVEAQADCRQVMSTDAGVLGSWFDLDTGEAVANIPRLGGYCIARDLFTGAPRTRFFCPFCSFVAMGCD